MSSSRLFRPLPAEASRKTGGGAKAGTDRQSELTASAPGCPYRLHSTVGAASVPLWNHLLSMTLLKRSLRLAAPIAAAYLVVVLGLLVEFIIVGNEIGGAGIAALGLAGTLALVLVLSFHAIEIASQAIIARRYGEGNRAMAGVVLDNALVLAFVAGVPLTLCLYALGPRVFGAESKEIRNLAFDYFRWRLPSIPFLIASLAMIGFFNGIGRPKIPMFVAAAILSSNALLCYGFVGGRIGFPELGIKGAGLAQSLSTAVGFGVFTVILLTRYRSDFGVFNFAENVQSHILRAVTVLAVPVFVHQFFGNFGFYLFMIINGMVPDGGVSLAAATIARQIGYLTYLPSIGFGIAAATLVGQALGARDPDGAQRGGFMCWALGASFMMSMGICFIVFSTFLVDIFLSHSRVPDELPDVGAQDPARVQELAELLLVMVGCYQILESTNTILGKALQGAGETYFVMKVAVGSQWLVFLPLAWLLALPMGYGAAGALAAFALQLLIAGLIFFSRFVAGGWKTREL